MMANAEQAGLPMLFISHGAAAEALAEDPFIDTLRQTARRIPAPAAIVVISGHWWESGPSQLTASPRPPTIHDFSGYPPPFYRLSYPVPGDPALAARIVAMLEAGGEAAGIEPARGLDHGVWIPLRALYPGADIPVLQLSIPAGRDPRQLARIGRLLEPLRAQGVLLIGSGGSAHNLFLRRPEKEVPAMAWAEQFDRWLAERLLAADTEAILDFQHRAPHAALAVPTPDHFDPLFYILGAMAPGERVSMLYQGIFYGCLSNQTFLFEPPAASR